MAIGFFKDTNSNANSSFLDRNIEALHKAYESTGRQPEETQKASAAILSAASGEIPFMNSKRNAEKMSLAFIDSMMNSAGLAISSPRGPGK